MICNVCDPQNAGAAEPEAGAPTRLHEFIYHSLLPSELRARRGGQF